MLRIVGLFLVVGVALVAFGQGLVARYSEPAPAASAAPARPAPPGPRAVPLSADASGHFSTDVRINGKFVKGLVDTGATIIALPLDEARLLGIDPTPASYTAPIQTANGRVMAARVTLNEVRIGPISVPGVEAVVVPQGLNVTLIGMSFFNRLQKFEMSGRTLVLRQ